MMSTRNWDLVYLKAFTKKPSVMNWQTTAYVSATDEQEGRTSCKLQHRQYPKCNNPHSKLNCSKKYFFCAFRVFRVSNNLSVLSALSV